MYNVGEYGDPTKGLALSKIMVSNQGRKWEEKEMDKQDDTTVKMTKRFEDIMAKKKEICVKRNDTEDKKKAEQFYKFIAMQRKMIKLQDKKPEPVAISEDTKMLTMKMLYLDPDAAKIVQAHVLGY
ncbi:hypothetical protein D1007_22173 [Hordeum vulgare]|nr:hypothetical protein D1007_22173 [Hordeum vulgare]